VAVFSASCEWPERVAEKGVTGAVASEQRRRGSSDEL
jgi:hypothetical protein